ncbi:serine/threonine protein kinase [Actinoallomurus sp. NBC_01490]|uniref:serine/threonine-protein kinase n=1 Tax=Actinoallomurus sp. NBC_01490 TaxID=2903557 RepID=UPI002E3622EF|nr:serine/threonine-protein kinase [Actinoallomurus sp. NBC_01490]
MATPSASADESLPAGIRPLTPEDPGRIGEYLLLGRLGHGGMGVVYLGRGPGGALVAVKIAHGETAGDEDVVRRYEAEVACLRRAPAAYVAGLVADGSAHRPPYIVTEYVEGRSLAQAVNADGPLSGTALRALAVGVARALAAVHRAGLIHRDVKPANIILTSTGPRLIDFGIARQVGDAGGPTGPGLVVGSPGWIPPERLERLPATPASDIFGWGCAVGFAATGRNPFGRGDPDVLAQRTMFDPPDLDGLDDSLRGPVIQALSKSPAGRPAAAELLAWLDWAGAAHGPVREPAHEVPAPATAPDPDLPHTGDQDPFPPGTASFVPNRRTAPAGGRSDTRDLPRPRRPSASGSVAVAATATAALVVVLLTTAADHDGRNPPARHGGTPTAAPSNAAATHRVATPRRRTHHPAARSSSAQPSPTHASAQSARPGKGKGKAKGRAKGKGPGG